MAKPSRDPLHEAMAQLAAVRENPDSEESLRTVRSILAKGTSAAVARAARLTGETELSALEPDLAAAFERFMSRPGHTDKGCLAKTEIARALYKLGSGNAGLFLTGARHVQMEPTWGGQADTAAHLRAECAMALVRANYPDAMIVLADLLADPEQPARLAAARAVGYSGDERGVALLRLKALTGDADPQVLSECFLSMLALSPELSVPFVARFLASEDEALAETAALALGTWGRPEGFPVLEAFWRDAASPELRPSVLLAIGMLRHAPALEFLLGLLDTEDSRTVGEALAALAIHRHDPAACRRVLAKLAERDELRIPSEALEPFLPA